MPPPSVCSLAQDVYNDLAPIAYDDANQGYALLVFLDAWLSPLQPLYDVIKDTDTAIGYASVMHPDTAPLAWLDWLGQFLGRSPRTGESEAQKRASIKAGDRLKRGGAALAKSLVQAQLTGTKYMIFNERAGSAWRTHVRTLASESPETDWKTFYNLIKNPSAEVDVSWWATSISAGATGVSLTRDASWYKKGRYSFRLVGTNSNVNDNSSRRIGMLSPTGTSGMAVTPGQTCRVQADIKVNDAGNGGVRFVILYYQSNGAASAVKAQTTGTAANAGLTGEFRLTLDDIVPSDAAYAAVRFEMFSTVASDTMDANIDQVMFLPDKGNTPPDYFDGSSAHASWQGTADLSASTLPPYTTIIYDILRSQKPGGIVLTYGVIGSVPTYDTILARYDSYQDVKNTYVTYTAMRDTMPTALT